jgi:tyrosine-protein kinase Etk/Wzc
LGLGLFLGIGLCFLLEFLDNTIKTEEDIQIYLKEKVTGLVLWDKKFKAQDFTESDLLTRSYGAVKTVLNFYRNEHLLKTMVVTSTVRAEGKSMTTLMLGKSFAQSGVKVLLVDMDLYRPQLAKRMKIIGKKGLSDYLRSDMNENEIIYPTDNPNLWVIPAGLIPKNPAEMIESEKILTLIESQKDSFDIIIFDTPPVTASFEVSVLASRVDGVLYAVKANETPRSLIRNTLTKLKMAKINVLGVLLTGTQQEYRESYYYYYKYYKDYYYTIPPEDLAEIQKVESQGIPQKT